MDAWHVVQFDLGRDALWNFFLNGFCVNLLRPLVVLVPLLVIFGGVGRSLGLPQLFRRESRWDRFWIGMGVGVVVWQAGLAGYLFEEFATNYTLDRPPFCERRPQSTTIWKYDGEYAIPVTDNADVRRYRFVPADVQSVLCYGGNVLVGGAVFALLGGLAVGVLRGVIRLADVLAKRVPRPRPVPPAAPLPGVTPLVGGLLVGVGVMAALGWALLPGKFVHSADGLPAHQQVVFEIGRVGVEFAGYGNAAARDARWTGDDPAAARNGVRHRLALYYPVYGLFAVGFVVVILVTGWLLWDPLHRVFHYRRRIFSPAAGLIFLLHLALLIQTVADYFVPFPQLVYLGLAALTLVCARAYKLRHPNVLPPGTPLRDLDQHFADVQAEYQRRQREAMDRTQKSTTREVLAALPEATTATTGKRLLATRDLGGWSPQAKKPLVLVCASGGGSRAAAWTVKVLTELEKRVEAAGGPPFPYHVRMVCGASGGIIGGAYYVSTLGEPTPAGGLPPDRADLRDALNDSVQEDFLTPVVHALVSRDLPGLFLPRLLPPLSRYDRGRALEWAFEKTLRGGLTQTFDDLLPGEQAGWRPSLVFSPMTVEDGRQLLISNLDLLDIIHNRGLPADPTAGEELLSREAVEFFRLFPDAAAFRVGTAARMSGSFPYVLPAVPLPTDPRRRVVDAGYYDNYGVGLAASWLFNHFDWIEKHVSRVAIVQIRDGVSTDDRLLTRPTDPPLSAPELAAEWLTTPPAALYQARVSANTFRNDNLLHLLHQRMHERFGPGVPFVTPAFEFPAGGDVSLSYCLTPAEGKLIDECLGGPPPADPRLADAAAKLGAKVDEFVRWFAAGASAPAAERGP